jgi:hypothetical protein
LGPPVGLIKQDAACSQFLHAAANVRKQVRELSAHDGFPKMPAVALRIEIAHPPKSSADSPGLFGV